MRCLLQVTSIIVIVSVLGCSPKGLTKPVSPTVRAVQPESSKTVIAAPDATRPPK